MNRAIIILCTFQPKRACYHHNMAVIPVWYLLYHVEDWHKTSQYQILNDPGNIGHMMKILYPASSSTLSWVSLPEVIGGGEGNGGNGVNSSSLSCPMILRKN